jgi:hypothetical protein
MTMAQHDNDQKDGEAPVNKSDQRQPHPGGLANQNVTRPAPIDQPESIPGQPENKDAGNPGAT